MTDACNVEKPWAVESTEPPYDIGMVVSLEEAPHWPDGTRMYRKDLEPIDRAVSEVMGAVHPTGKFDYRLHESLALALTSSMLKHRAAENEDELEDSIYLSLAFVAGAAWARATQPVDQQTSDVEESSWWNHASFDLEPEILSAKEFPRRIEILRDARPSFEKNHPGFSDELDLVQYHGAKPSPELLATLEYRLVEVPV